MLVWSLTQHGQTWTGLGDQALLNEPLTAFFASRQCPGTAIRAALDWALEQARGRQPVVSGFHSPLEQSVLTVLLHANCPVVAVMARPVAGARLPSAWAEPLVQGRMAVVSAAARSGRLTEELAAQRNEWVALLGRQIVVAHASPGGRLAVLCEGWGRAGWLVRQLN
jgi:hypothetical protein